MTAPSKAILGNRNMTTDDKIIFFDIETNGLLDTVDTFYCSWVYNLHMDKWVSFRDAKALCDYLSQSFLFGYKVCGHNIINYDIPALQKLNPEFHYKEENIIDTLVLSRLIYSNIKATDHGLIRAKKLPARLMGSHSLMAWGYRLGELKGTYGQQEGAWDGYSEEMLKYCKQDVLVTYKLYEKLTEKPYSKQAIDLEHKIAFVMAQQERDGFDFDVDKASNLYAVLKERQSELYDSLVKTFGSWKEYKGIKVYKRDNAKMNIKAGVEYPIYENVTFNPNSQRHVAKVLQERGWKPTEFTATGIPKVDESTLSEIKGIPEVELIIEYKLVTKRIGQVAEGDNGWLKMYKENPDGKGYAIHGSVNPNGAVTGRASHSNPNVAQVPSINSPYGAECRECFKAPEGWYQAGIDASGLELRCLAHYLSPFDNGDYGNIILNGDIHTHNQQVAGLPSRNQAKTMIYCLLYGGGDAKLGSVVGGDAREGKKLKEKFFKGIPAYKHLVESLENSLVASQKWVGDKNIVRWKRRTYEGRDITHCILGLDGRVIYVRSPHSALNTLLQSAGSIVCKQWVVQTRENLLKKYRIGRDGDLFFMAWVHDEIQVACRTKEIAEDVVKIAQDSMRETQKILNFRVQLDTEGKIGKNWKDCH